MRIGGDWTRTNGDRSRGIYSPLQLPLCDTPLRKKSLLRSGISSIGKMLAKGLEPSTIRLQVGRSTIELHQHETAFQDISFFLSSQVGTSLLKNSPS